MLAFTQRVHRDEISLKLLSAGIHLYDPDTFNPADYPTKPALDNPHRNLFGAGLGAGEGVAGGSRYTAAAALGLSSGMGGRGSGNEANLTEEEKKEQINSIYSALSHAEDIPEIEPSPLIKTKLFPHQRQALAFMLMREKDRTFEDVVRRLKIREDAVKEHRKKITAAKKDRQRRREKGEELPASDEETEEQRKHVEAAVAHAASESSRTKGKSGAAATADIEDKMEEDGGTVSLWKPLRNTFGGIKGYWHAVLRITVKDKPEICRGAILADDMGLGKTISVIALIAHTRDQSFAFAASAPTGKKGPAPMLNQYSSGSSLTRPLMLSDSDSSSDSDEPDFQGLSRSKKGKGKAKPGKGKGKEPQGSNSSSANKKLRDAAGFATKVAAGKGPTRKERAAEQEAIRKANLDTRSRATLIVCPMSIISNWVSDFALVRV